MYLYFNFTPVKIMLSTIKNKKGSVQRTYDEKFRKISIWTSSKSGKCIIFKRISKMYFIIVYLEIKQLKIPEDPAFSTGGRPFFYCELK